MIVCRGYPKTEQRAFDGLSNVKILQPFEGPRELKLAARFTDTENALANFSLFAGRVRC